MTRRRLITVICALVALASRAFPHGDVHEQIASVTRELERDPASTALLLRRGELHRLHQDWGAALEDFQRAAALDPKLAGVDFHRGRVLFEAGHPREAVACLDRMLAHQPAHAEALLTRARAHAKLGDARASANDYSAALARFREPQPDHFIERAQALATLGPRGIDEAIRSLDEGQQRLGALVVLQQAALDLELSRQCFDAALARLDSILSRANRKETWLARRGGILEQAQRPVEARAAYAAALHALEQLPGTHRESPAMGELEQKLRDRLARLTDNAKVTPSTAARREP